MRKNIKLILGIISLIVLGIFLGKMLQEPERVVLFDSGKSDSNSMKVVPATMITPNANYKSLNDFNEAFVEIASNVTPSVVTIITEKVIKSNINRSIPGFDDEFFQHFFGIPQPQDRRGEALGSGVIVNKNGYIITNNHVVENGETIKVKLLDEREYDAEIIGTDKRTDLAIIKINAKNLIPAKLGNSEKLRVGEWVVAIGSPLSDQLAHTVTSGIVSAKGRNSVIGNNIYGSMIQTDAAINPGNSGGALVDIRGELIGINTAIATSGGYAGNIGIGFAIPIDMAKKVMRDLIEKGKVERAWLGVQIQDVDDRKAKAMKLETREGALISEVVEDSPAEKGGLKVGDVVIEVDGKKVKSSSHLQYLIGNREIGETVKIDVIRGKKKISLKILLGEFPESNEVVTSESSESITKFGLDVDNITNSIAREYGIDPDEPGVVITNIERDCDASRRLREGDIIKRIGNIDINNLNDYKDAIKNIDEEYILILVKRKNNTFFVTLKVME